ncbi:MAG: DUF1214 domain-containing protein [Pseudomonadota bacterium]
MLKRIAIYALTGIFGLGLGAYTALAMSGLLPGDRRAEAAIDLDGWMGDLSQGSADASPYLRARIARYGLLALAKSEAIYFIRAADDTGEALSEDCTYRLAGGPMPAGWWSVTLYNADSFLPDNTDQALSFDASRAGDGAWSAIVSPVRPDDQSNWISSRNAGQFDLTLRLYMPNTETLDAPAQAITAPSVERASCTGDRS